MTATTTTATEYVDDVPYVRQFVSELGPVQLRLATALNGFKPPPGDELDYCELGCAHGDTIAALAASHPRGRFLGIDISAMHIASAKKLVRDGALENVGFLERDFGDLLHEDIGEFDFITAHGVLSWISPDKRKQLLEFARAKLKPGGILYVTYNAMPGWASVEPLRQLLLSPMGKSATEDQSVDRARRGLEFAHAMQRLGAEYFVKNPSASEMLAMMTKVGLPYVVHEYLHEHWVPMYFARVAWEMAAHDLDFVGVLPVLLNFRDTAIPATLVPVFTDVTDRLTFESLKDFAINEFFRRDLYVKKDPTAGSLRSTEVTGAYLDTTPFGLPIRQAGGAAADDRTVQLPHRTLSLEGPVFDALLTAFSKGATTLHTLMNESSLPSGVFHDELRGAITRLLVAERIVPMTCATTTTTTSHDATSASSDRRYRVPSVYNQMMLRRLSSDLPIVMASTKAGTAMPISALEGLAIRVLTEVDPDKNKRDQWMRDLVGKNVMRMRIADRVIEDRAEQQKAIEQTIDQMVSSHRLAKLVELGVLVPATPQT